VEIQQMLAITMKGENAGGVSEGTLKITF